MADGNRLPRQSDLAQYWLIYAVVFVGYLPVAAMHRLASMASCRARSGRALLGDTGAVAATAARVAFAG